MRSKQGAKLQPKHYMGVMGQLVEKVAKPSGMLHLDVDGFECTARGLPPGCPKL